MGCRIGYKTELGMEGVDFRNDKSQSIVCEHSGRVGLLWRIKHML